MCEPLYVHARRKDDGADDRGNHTNPEGGDGGSRVGAGGGRVARPEGRERAVHRGAGGGGDVLDMEANALEVAATILK